MRYLFGSDRTSDIGPPTDTTEGPTLVAYIGDCPQALWATAAANEKEKKENEERELASKPGVPQDTVTLYILSP